MNQSIARFETARASGYLQQLCKHFAHKLAVEFTPSQGQIPFSAGTCRLEASDRTLTMRVEAPDASGLAQVQDVIERHLLRFAFREPARIEWHAVDAAA
jgi:hypothetical protein